MENVLAYLPEVSETVLLKESAAWRIRDNCVAIDTCKMGLATYYQGRRADPLALSIMKLQREIIHILSLCL